MTTTKKINLLHALKVAREYVHLQNQAEGLFDGFNGKKPRPSTPDLEMIDACITALSAASPTLARVQLPSGWHEIANDEIELFINEGWDVQQLHELHISQSTTQPQTEETA